MRTSQASLRRRNAALECLERFRRVDEAATVLEIVAFLYICENEGLNVSELALACNTTLASASRVVKRLTANGDGPMPLEPLAQSRRSAAGSRTRLIFLTDSGRALRDEFDRTIRAGHLIVLAAPETHPEPEPEPA